MLIYLVRWPDLSASFVRAGQTVKSTFWTSSIRWGTPMTANGPFIGPLFIDFRLPLEWTVQDDGRESPVTTQQVVLGDTSRIADGGVVEAMQLRLAEGDDGYETGAEVLRLAFPKLHAAVEGAYEDGGSPDREETLSEAELRKALYAELDRFFTGSWRHAHLGKKTDAVSRLAYDMDCGRQRHRKAEKTLLGPQSRQNGFPECNFCCEH